MKKQNDCEHEKIGKIDDNSEICRECEMIFVYCHACSLAGDAERAIYHEGPPCKS